MPEIFEAIAVAQITRLLREVTHQGVVAVLVEQKGEVVLQLSRLADAGDLRLCFVTNLGNTNKPSSDLGSIPCHVTIKRLSAASAPLSQTYSSH